MKRIFFVFILLLVSGFAFSDDFQNIEKIVDDFWNKGAVIKIIDGDDITYVNKSCITTIQIDDDELEVSTNGYNIMTGKNNDSEEYNFIRKWNLQSDENYNIILIKKWIILQFILEMQKNS